MKFYTQYNNISEKSTTGKKTITTYTRETNAITGETKLIKSGTRNIYNEIQEASIGITLKEIIRKYENNEVLPINENLYLDTSTTPNNKIELHNLIKEAEKNLEKLKQTTKKQIPEPEKEKKDETK